jgi:alpha,alpha-trehalase
MGQAAYFASSALGDYDWILPLWARLAPRERAQAMIERFMLNPKKLWAPHGVRSLAAVEPLYNSENVIKPYSNWQGPIWPHANWMFMHALIHYGYREAALDVAERVTRLCRDD